MARMKVQYVGVTSDFRALTEADLAGWDIKVELPPSSPLARRYVKSNGWDGQTERPLDPTRDLVWGPHNHHTMELDVSPELEMLLRAQGHFVLTEVKDSGEDGDQVAAPTDVRHPGDRQIVRDGTSPEQRSETDRETDPAVLDRPDPAWEAAVAASEAASAASGEVKG